MKAFTLAAFGDSLTYGYGVLSHVAFPARLAAELPEKRPHVKWQIYNRGINGETTREALRRLDNDILRLKPHITTILLGSNDSALNDGQYRTIWEYEQNMIRILEAIKANKHTDPDFNNGYCLPLLITPPPVVDTDFYPFTSTDRLENYRDVVLKLAEAYNCPVLDLFSVLTEIKETKGFDAYDAMFQFDGVHLSNAAYDILYQLLEEKILELTENF